VWFNDREYQSLDRPWVVFKTHFHNHFRSGLFDRYFYFLGTILQFLQAPRSLITLRVPVSYSGKVLMDIARG